jgi:tyrosinase
MLRAECGYRGAQPYWDWTLDASVETFASSPVFDSVYGFGGNGPFVPYNDSTTEVAGRSGGGCVMDGPFKNLTVHPGPFNSTARNDQCLKRDIAPVYASWALARSKVEEVLAQPDFGHLTKLIEVAAFDNKTQMHTGGQ